MPKYDVLTLEPTCRHRREKPAALARAEARAYELSRDAIAYFHAGRDRLGRDARAEEMDLKLRVIPELRQRYALPADPPAEPLVLPGRVRHDLVVQQ